MKNQLRRAMLSTHKDVLAARFRELFSHMPLACFTFDSSGVIQQWNRSAESLFELSGNRTLSTTMWQTVGASGDGLWSLEFVNDVFKGVPIAGREWLLKTANCERHLICDVFPVKTESGKIIGAISANSDITERKEAEQLAKLQLDQFSQAAEDLESRRAVLERANVKLEKLSTIDGLTGLCNHKHFHEEMKRLNAERKRLKQPISIALIDLDDFKRINDTYGHPEGDTILRSVAKILQRYSRKQDCVARYGGEEFAVIMSGTSEAAAWIVAERFRAAIEDANGSIRDVTASVGVATHTEFDKDTTGLIALADLALYVSKQNGRNQTTSSSCTVAPTTPDEATRVA
jgi:diguanylate cyclase (GGDEF)-like protein/PAS domain S-box-containing protein